MKRRVMLAAAAIAAAVLTGLASLMPEWLRQQGASTESLQTAAFWKSQGKMLEAMIQKVPTALPWTSPEVLAGAIVAATGLLMLVGVRLYRQKPQAKSSKDGRRGLVLALEHEGTSAAVIARRTGLSRDAIRSISQTGLRGSREEALAGRICRPAPAAARVDSVTIYNTKTWRA